MPKKGQAGPTPANFINLVGQRFGRLTVITRAASKKRWKTSWECRCECGAFVTVSAMQLRQGETRSCGCLNRDAAAERQRTHGLSETPEYRVWGYIYTRCYNKSRADWPRYGGRGIMMCDRWRLGENGASGFECFLADMGKRPSPKHSIDRINNDGDYEPMNCRWATRSEQMRNTHRSASYKPMAREAACHE